MIVLYQGCYRCNLLYFKKVRWFAVVVCSYAQDFADDCTALRICV